MSILIGLKLNDAVVMATDSIMYTDDGHIISTSQQKIIEIAPGLFYGWTGGKRTAFEQARIAAELYRTKRTDDLLAFAEELNTASISVLKSEAERLSGEQAAGETPFQIYMLAGKSNGVPGFYVCWYTRKGGEIHRSWDSDFRPDTENRIVHFMTGESAEEVWNNPATWLDGLVGAAEQFVDHMRKSDPKCYGGPTQIATVDKDGARWVQSPPDGRGGVKWRPGKGTKIDTDGTATLDTGSGLGFDAMTGKAIVRTANGLGFDVGGRVVPNFGATVGLSPTGQIVVPAGSLGLTEFGGVYQPYAFYYGLPSPYDATVPKLIINTVDYKIYRNTGGAWSKQQDPADIIAGTITALVSLISPTISGGAISGTSYTATVGNVTITIDPSNGRVRVNNSGLSWYVDVDGGGCYVRDRTYPNSTNAYITGGQVGTQNYNPATGHTSYATLNSNGRIFLQGADGVAGGVWVDGVQRL